MRNFSKLNQYTHTKICGDIITNKKKYKYKVAFGGLILYNKCKQNHSLLPIGPKEYYIILPIQ